MTARSHPVGTSNMAALAFRAQATSRVLGVFESRILRDSQRLYLVTNNLLVEGGLVHDNSRRRDSAQVPCKRKA